MLGEGSSALATVFDRVLKTWYTIFAKADRSPGMPLVAGRNFPGWMVCFLFLGYPTPYTDVGRDDLEQFPFPLVPCLHPKDRPADEIGNLHQVILMRINLLNGPDFG
jgi:hypothetical protein